ncbi:MAG: vancomycin high temperature exclusion protein [Polyangia bacterium]
MSDAPPARARRRWGRWVAGCLLVFALLIGAGNAYVLSVTAARRLPQAADAQPQQYAMVLGNRVFPRRGPSWELACRLETGRQLYLAGRARRVIVSGRYRPDLGYDEPAVMAAWLEARGVPRRDLILDRGGYRTASSMADAAAIGVRSLLVVSQAYHLPRALYLAQHAGIDAWGVPSCNAHRNWAQAAHLRVRESLARAEAILEVLVRGVRGAGPLPENPIARRVANGHSLG